MYFKPILSVNCITLLFDVHNLKLLLNNEDELPQAAKSVTNSEILLCLQGCVWSLTEYLNQYCSLLCLDDIYCLYQTLVWKISFPLGLLLFCKSLSTFLRKAMKSLAERLYLIFPFNLFSKHLFSVYQIAGTVLRLREAKKRNVGPAFKEHTKW